MMKLNVGVIGLNRVAIAMATSFETSGHNIVGHSLSSVKSDAQIKGLSNYNTSFSPVELAEKSNLLLLGVPGKDIRKVVADIAMEGKFHSEQFVVHIAGEHGIDVLEEAENLGAQVFALHPVGIASKNTFKVGALFDLPFVVTSRPMLRPVAEALVYDLNGKPFWLDNQYRARYHALFTQATSNIASLMISVITSLRDIGIDEPEKLIGPHMRMLLEKVFLNPSSIFLDGPIISDDVNSTQVHLDALRDDFLQKKIYIDLTILTIDQMLENGIIHPESAESYLQILKNENC